MCILMLLQLYRTVLHDQQITLASCATIKNEDFMLPCMSVVPNTRTCEQKQSYHHKLLLKDFQFVVHTIFKLGILFWCISLAGYRNDFIRAKYFRSYLHI